MNRSHAWRIALTSSGLVLIGALGAAPAVSAAPVVDAPRHQVSTLVIPEPGGGGDGASDSACGAARMAVGCSTTEVPSTARTQRTIQSKAERFTVESDSLTGAPATATVEDAQQSKAERFTVESDSLTGAPATATVEDAQQSKAERFTAEDG